MTLESLTMPYPWARYSRKLQRRITQPRNVGSFTPIDAEGRGMRLAVGRAGEVDEGNVVVFYWFVDPEDGVIADSKFQVYGQSALIGAADAACEIVLGKNYDQARRLSAELIDKELRDRNNTPAFPRETSSHVNLVLEAIEEAGATCVDIPLPKNYTAPPAPIAPGEVLEGGYPGWATLTDEQKLAIIEEVLDREVRPYIALDAGGVAVQSLEGSALIISYEGACTSCFASVGATLSYIQQTLRNQVHPDLSVIPTYP